MQKKKTQFCIYYLSFNKRRRRRRRIKRKTRQSRTEDKRQEKKSCDSKLFHAKRFSRTTRWSLSHCFHGWSHIPGSGHLSSRKFYVRFPQCSHLIQTKAALWETLPADWLKRSREAWSPKAAKCLLSAGQIDQLVSGQLGRFTALSQFTTMSQFTAMTRFTEQSQFTALTRFTAHSQFL